MASNISRQYAKKMASSAERSRLLSAVGRDIGFLPPVKDPIRKIKCSKDLKTFLLTYFPDKFSKPFGDNHIKLINALQECILHDGKQVIVALPRGTGKSTICTFATVFALCYSYRKYVVVVSSSQKESRRLVEILKKVIQSGGTFADDFPEVVYPLRLLRGSYNLAKGQLYQGEPVNSRLSSDLIRFPTIPGSPCSGNVVSCFGLTSSIRGQSEVIQNEYGKSELARPDLVLLDDVQKASTAQSATQVEKLESLIFGDIAGLAESGRELSMVMTGTVIQKDDLCDRFLSDRYPWFTQIRGKALDPMPSNMDMWKEYRNILYTQDQNAATQFYKANMEQMKEGAKVSWEADYDPNNSPYLDALELNMVRWAKNEKAFFAEYQNDPIPEAGGVVLVPVKELTTKLNGLEKGVCADNIFKITCFCDVHADILYYTVYAWQKDYTGYCIDYGVFPEQNRPYFSKDQGGLLTLSTAFNTGADLALRMGLEILLNDLSKREYASEDGEFHRIDRIFVDEGWRWEIVSSAIQRVKAANINPSMGRAITASNRPMSLWRKSPHRIFHYHIVEEKLQNHRYKSFLIDTNFWKSLLHQKLGLPVGEKGSISFYGDNPEEHRMLLEHIGGSEIPTTVTASGGTTVDEWRNRPQRPDNHLFDCSVGCLACASLLNIQIDGVTQKKRGKTYEMPEL